MERRTLVRADVGWTLNDDDDDDDEYQMAPPGEYINTNIQHIIIAPCSAVLNSTYNLTGVIVLCDKEKNAQLAGHYFKLAITYKLLLYDTIIWRLYGDLVQQSKSIKISMDHVTKQMQTGDLVRILVGRDKTIIRCLLV